MTEDQVNHFVDGCSYYFPHNLHGDNG
jgi:hypothetical protein